MANLRYLSNPELVFDNKGGSIFNDKTGSVLQKSELGTSSNSPDTQEC